MNDEYELLIRNCTTDKKKRKRIRINTGSDWRRAIIPLQFLMCHDEIQNESSKQYVRVMLQETMTIFDISNEDWEKLIADSY